MMIVVPELQPPMGDIKLLFGSMGGTGIATVGVVYLLYRRRAFERFNSLRWTLLATIILTVVLVFVNVFLTAKFMYISYHDLTLTTALLVFAGVIAIISANLISGVIIDRIRELAKAARQVAKGNLRTRLAAEGNDELTDLAKTFNDMAAALQTVDEQKRLLEQARRDLIAWVSHDLRTPLASMRVMVEAMADGVVTDAQTVSRYHQNIQNEIQHLSHLIDDLFELAQLDTGHLTLEKQTISLRDLISDTLGSMSARAAQSGVQISGTVDDAVSTACLAPDKIQRVLYNLLDNALHHTPPDGEVSLRARQHNGAIQIAVHNTGSSISPGDLPHIFTSFYRGERSRMQTKDGYRGTGLGLAIARGFVEAHGGHITVESKPELGTTFTINLPRE
ncbi:MAG: HAMP domain-containing histidine kinase, partial [Anaerolineae bacterium]|nr:HAMP domain-containing histidine kinase [Anaerolineae bacterium]